MVYNPRKEEWEAKGCPKILDPKLHIITSALRRERIIMTAHVEINKVRFCKYKLSANNWKKLSSCTHNGFLDSTKVL